YNEEEEELTVFAVNKSLDEDMELTCDLRQFADYKVAEHVVLTHDDMKAVNTQEDPDQVAPKAGGKIGMTDGKLSGVLGKHSWNMIRLSRQNKK
ncbi:MAG: alpha-N-arabinofuranosidase, partial [Clostridia bacterium]|nr:alpha-N-arabinofuranosidase [Clostridia bacterium]